MQSRKRNGPGLAPVPSVFTRPGDPADVRAKHWTFNHITQGGNTDIHGRHMNVPMDDSTVALGVRQHEMLHVAISPMPTGRLDSALLAAEDGRIEIAATDQGLAREAVMSWDELEEKIGNCADDFTLACLAVCVLGSPADSDVADILADMGRPDMLAIRDQARAIYAADPSWQSTEDVAAMLRKLRDDDNDDDSQDGPGEPQDGQGGDGQGDSQGGPGEPQDGSQSGQDGRPMHGLIDSARPKPKQRPASNGQPAAMSQPTGGHMRPGESATAQDNRQDGIEPFDVEQYERDAPQRFGQDRNWADPVLETPKRVIRLADRGTKRGRATDTGVVPRNLARTAIDGKVFGQRRHRKRGTVLLDLSGSTAYVHKIIPDLIRQIPATVVAGYSGSGCMGTLRILAANGKAVAPHLAVTPGGSNSIDGPAVAWLARQHGPRIWVHDGMPNGVTGTVISDEMLAELQHHVRAARIKVIDPRDYKTIVEDGDGGVDIESDLDALVRDITRQMK